MSQLNDCYILIIKTFKSFIKSFDRKGPRSAKLKRSYTRRKLQKGSIN